MITLEEIYQGLAGEFQNQTGRTAGGSSELAVRFYAVAAQLYSLYVQGEWVRRQCFPQTAQGEALDQHAQLRGVTRRQAAKAAGTVRFYVDQPRQGDTPVAAGTVCMTAAGVRFVTEADGTVPAGALFCDAPVTAVQAGGEGNAEANTVVYMALPPVGIAACANPEALRGGQDAESDEALRERVLDTYRRLANGANNAFYAQTAMSFPEVAAVTVLPKNRGVGTVDLVVAAQEGAPGQALLDKLQAHFDRVREIACDVKVLAPAVEAAELELTLWPQEGRDFEAVDQAVRARLTGWFTGERLGQSLLRAQLTSLVFAVDGVANCAFSRPAQDLALDRMTLPVLGQLTILNGGEAAGGEV